MSGDEGIVTIVAVILGPAAWALWVFRLAGVQRLKRGRAFLGVLIAVLVACALLLLAVLDSLSAPDVREAPSYLFMYFALGLAWMRVAEFVFAYAGISVRDDVIERGNGAALSAAAGALVGVTFCYAGGNIGAGPGWWVVVFAAILATAGLGAIWLLVDRIANVADLVTIDRDAAAGARFGGLLAACGLILGRAVAGDWVSAGVTIADFPRVAWIAIPIVAVALVVERAAKPTVAQPRPSVVLAGVVPALIYLSAALAAVVALGWPV